MKCKKKTQFIQWIRSQSTTICLCDKIECAQTDHNISHDYTFSLFYFRPRNVTFWCSRSFTQTVAVYDHHSPSLLCTICKKWWVFICVSSAWTGKVLYSGIFHPNIYESYASRYGQVSQKMVWLQIRREDKRKIQY